MIHDICKGATGTIRARLNSVNNSCWNIWQSHALQRIKLQKLSTVSPYTYIIWRVLVLVGMDIICLHLNQDNRTILPDVVFVFHLCLYVVNANIVKFNVFSSQSLCQIQIVCFSFFQFFVMNKHRYTDHLVQILFVIATTKIKKKNYI